MLSALMFTMCNSKQTEKTEDFDWILGKWQRTNDEEGRKTFENWDKISNAEYSGIGYTMQNNDTISQEQMKIVESNGKWSLLVKTHDEKDFIQFDISELQKEQFEFKNEAHDFPKSIKYWKNGDHMHALVSDDSLKLSFEFEPLK